MPLYASLAIQGYVEKSDLLRIAVVGVAIYSVACERNLIFSLTPYQLLILRTV